MIKKILVQMLWVIAGAVAVVLIYFLLERILSRMSSAGEVGQPEEITVYILTNGVHTDIVMPVTDPVIDWRIEFPPQNTVKPDTSAQLIALGWGDRGFFLETPTWADLRFSTAFKAVSGLGKSAIHATYYPGLNENNSCRKIMISRDQYRRLVQFVQNSLERSPNGKSIVIPTTANYGGNDAFYEAKRSYSLFNTCNTWTNNALKSCGQKASVWTAFDSGIFYQYRNH